MDGIQPPTAPTAPRRPVPPSAGQRPSVPSAPQPRQTAAPPPAPTAAPPANDIRYQPDPTLEKRQLPFEPTGWYEQAAGVLPTTLQLNASGRAIVGWLTLPPGHDFAKQAKLASWPRAEPLSCAVVVVDGRIAGQDGSYPMHWVMDRQPLGSPNTADPTDLLRVELPSTSLNGVGTFRYTRPGQVELAFRAGGPSDLFIQYATGPRLPSAALVSADPAARELLTVHHLSPLAPRWIAEVMRPLSDAATVTRLKKWHSTRGDLPAVSNLARRQVIAGLYCPALLPGALPESHRLALRGLVQTRLSLVDLTIGGTTHSLWDWFRTVASTETDELERKPLVALGLYGDRSTGWAYILDFNGVTPDLAGATLGLKADAMAFILRIRRRPITFVMDKGAPQLDEAGELSVTDPQALKAAEEEAVLLQPGGTPQLSTYVDRTGEVLFGVMGNLGAGLQIDLVKLVKSPEILSSFDKASGSATTRITFLTSADLTAKDFDGAWYHLIALGGPAVGNKAASFTMASSALHLLSLANGLQLSRVKTKVLESDLKAPPTKEIANALRGKFDWFTGLFKPKVTVGTISASLAWIHLMGSASGTPPTSPRPVVPQRSIRTMATHTTLFRRDEPLLIRSSSDVRADARMMLEAIFATHRAVLTPPRASVTITGYASPEGSTPHNVWLSSARAVTVERALQLSSPWQTAAIATLGLGEHPGRKAGLTDPPLGPDDLNAWMHRHPDEVAKWPEWRRVDIRIEGAVVLRGYELAPGP